MLEVAERPLDTPKSLRVQRGLTQEEAAQLAHITQRTLTEIDAGRDVRLSSIRRYAKSLGVTEGALVDAMARERALRNSRRMFSARLHKKGVRK